MSSVTGRIGGEEGSRSSLLILEKDNGRVKRLYLPPHCIFCLRKTVPEENGRRTGTGGIVPDDQVPEADLSGIALLGSAFLSTLNWTLWAVQSRKEVEPGILDFGGDGEPPEKMARVKTLPKICQDCEYKVIGLHNLLYKVSEQILRLKDVVRDSGNGDIWGRFKEHFECGGLDREEVEEAVKFYGLLRGSDPTEQIQKISHEVPDISPDPVSFLDSEGQENLEVKPYPLVPVVKIELNEEDISSTPNPTIINIRSEAKDNSTLSQSNSNTKQDDFLSKLKARRRMTSLAPVLQLLPEPKKASVKVMKMKKKEKTVQMPVIQPTCPIRIAVSVSQEHLNGGEEDVSARASNLQSELQTPDPLSYSGSYANEADEQPVPLEFVAKSEVVIVEDTNSFSSSPANDQLNDNSVKSPSPKNNIRDDFLSMLKAKRRQRMASSAIELQLLADSRKKAKLVESRVVQPPEEDDKSEDDEEEDSFEDDSSSSSEDTDDNESYEDYSEDPSKMGNSSRLTSSNPVRQPCTICRPRGTKLKIINDMDTHLQEVHGLIPSKIIKCPLCPFLFASREPLVDHIADHAVLICDICGVTGGKFREHDLLREHYFKKHQVGKQYKCEKCPRVFWKRGSLGIHVALEHCVYDPQASTSVTKQKCNDCGAEFKTKYSLRDHQIKFHNGEKYNCTYCSETFTTRRILKRHEQVVHEGLPLERLGLEHPCREPNCGETFQTKMLLAGHYSSVHLKTVKGYSCNLCEQVFPEARDLKMHKKAVHFGNKAKKYVCGICGMGFMKWGNWRLHKLTHTELRP